MKKVVSSIILALLPMMANAYFWESYPGYDAKIDGICYKFSGESATVSYEWYIVSEDGESYESEYSGSVVIPESVTHEGKTYRVTSIGGCAFYGCAGLTSITLPSSLTSISNNAFEGCRGLTAITVPSNVTVIYDAAFKDCTGLTSATIPNSVTGIGAGVFQNCTGLTSIVTPETVTYIGSGAFEDTPWYDNLPEGLIYIGKVAYRYKGNMPSDSRITIKEGTVEIATNAFYGYTNLASITTPKSLNNIRSNAFENCSGLNYITLSETVEFIDNKVFSGCTGLKEIHCYAKQPPTIVLSALNGVNVSDITLYVPEESVNLYKTTSPWSNFGNIVALSLDLTQIRIKDRPGETLEYIGKIGSDFDTALDSLRILKNISSEIEKEPLEVLFDYDDRLFFGIIYGDCAMYSDVLDTEGYYYLRTWYSQDETSDPVTFTEGQMATIILPTNPDASKGKYYRLDRYEDGQIIFEQELQPQAHIPYIIVPNEDFSINLRTLDLTGLSRDTVSIAGISFIGSFTSEEFDYEEGAYIDIIDKTPDCRFDESCVIGALRAYLLVHWDDPYNQGGTRVPPLNKREIVLRDDETGIKSLNATVNHNDKIFNLAGQRLSKPQKGIYIENGKIKAKTK